MNRPPGTCSLRKTARRFSATGTQGTPLPVLRRAASRNLASKDENPKILNPQGISHRRTKTLPSRRLSTSGVCPCNHCLDGFVEGLGPSRRNGRSRGRGCRLRHFIIPSHSVSPSHSGSRFSRCCLRRPTAVRNACTPVRGRNEMLRGGRADHVDAAVVGIVVPLRPSPPEAVTVVQHLVDRLHWCACASK